LWDYWLCSLKNGDVLVFDRMNKESVNCNQGIALSPLISVQRNLDAKSNVLAFLRGQATGSEAPVAFAPAYAMAA